MQIFLPFINPKEVASVLDPRRLNKQIIECDWILNAGVNNTRAQYHPIYKMYKDNLDFVKFYQECLIAYRGGNESLSKKCCNMALSVLPEFFKDAQWYFDNFKKRLYTKDPNYYALFESYGQSQVNYYYVDGEWLEY